MKVSVLSLFDGMACGMLAMRSAGIEVGKYTAYEIDKYAIKVASHNFPMIEQKGDVFVADFTQYEGIDYVIGGSPCTYWSIAQKNNRETEASGMGLELFSQYVRAIHEAKPKYFIYENNKSMSKEIRTSIDKAFGFEAICINSALVSAQNRKRLYWVGRRNEDGTYSKVPIEQPENRGILLRDVLDSGFDLTSNDKAYCLTASYNPCAWNTIERKQRNMVLDPIRVGTMPQLSGALKDNQATRIYSTEGKGATQSAQGGGWGAKTGLYACPVVDSEQHGNARYTLKNLKYRDEKTGTLTACCYKGIGADGMFAVAELADGKTQPIYEVRNGLITIKDKQYPIKLADGFYIIRKLTVNECKRLQTVAEWYDFSVISNSQAYKCLGNGWTVEVIAHLIKATQKGSK